jgi:hypothetical protein
MHHADFGVWRWHKRSGENPQSEDERSGVLQQEIGGFGARDRGKTHDVIKTQQKDAAVKQQLPAFPRKADSVWEVLGIKPCGPLGFRFRLEGRWASRNGHRPSVVIGETVDAWEAESGDRLRGAAPLFRALDNMRRRERSGEGSQSQGSTIHRLTAEEIPA